MDGLSQAGLGLGRGELRLERTTEDWLRAGKRLCTEVATALANEALAVELIGSAAVIGLLAKPIMDVAVSVPDPTLPTPVKAKLEASGWRYRGDAADAGGHVFVLGLGPSVRVANLHVVEAHSVQWRDWLNFRDLLRRSPEARARYEATKIDLLRQDGIDRRAYTHGKTAVVSSLLREASNGTH